MQADHDFDFEQISKEELQTELSALQQSIRRDEWRYYNIDCVENFIYHLDDFSSDRTRIRVANKISEYLSFVEEKIKEAESFAATDRSEYRQRLKNIRKDLNPLYWPISQLYSYELGFVIKPAYLFLTLSMVVLFFILNYFYSSTLALIIVCGYSLFRIVYTQLKIKARKVY